MHTADAEISAIVRNLHEVADAILMRQVDHLITTRTVYIGGNFLYLAHRAFFFGTLGHLIKVLETHNRRTGSFHWLYNRNKEEIDRFARTNNYDMASLWSFSENVRDLRNKTIFHIDRHGLLDATNVWKTAGISGFDVGRVLETLWHCLQHLHYIKVGEYHTRIPALERQLTEQILDFAVDVIERADVSLGVLSATNLSADV